MLRVTPIYGSCADTRGPSNTARCTLIEYGGVSVLWNVGYNTGGFPDLPPHDALIVSDSTLGSIGGLPLYCKQQRQRGQGGRHPSQQGHDGQGNKTKQQPLIFATFPTAKMGQMTLYDQHASVCLDGRKPPYTLEELDSSISALKTIKYSQTMIVHDQNNQPALSITAQRSGHVVGGSFFLLQRLQDDTVVVLTSTYHVAKELHLGPATLLKYGSTPDVLVTYPGGPAMGQLSLLYGSLKPKLSVPVVTQAEKQLVESVLAVLRRDGHVLLPVDASGRVLEVLLLLSQYWDRHRLTGAYNLCWLGPMAKNTIDFARSQLEWMAAPLGAQFDTQRGHPYALKNVHICTSLPELDRAMASNGNPTCVLATGASLDHGPARDLLLRFADNQDHAIIFTDSSQCVGRSGTVLQQTKQSLSSVNVDQYGVNPNTTTVAMPGTAQKINTTITNPDSGASNDTAAVTVTTTTAAAAAAATGEEAEMAGSIITAAEVSDFCTAGQLLSQWCAAKVEGREMDDVIYVDVLVPQKMPLVGAELKAFLAEEEATRRAKKAAEERQAMLHEVELAKGRLRLGEDDDRNAASAGKKVGVLSQIKKKSATLLSSSGGTTGIRRPRKKSRFDSSLFLKFSKPQHRE